MRLHINSQGNLVTNSTNQSRKQRTETHDRFNFLLPQHTQHTTPTGRKATSGHRYVVYMWFALALMMWTWLCNWRWIDRLLRSLFVLLAVLNVVAASTQTLKSVVKTTSSVARASAVGITDDRHEQPQPKSPTSQSQQLFNNPKYAIKTIGILVYDGFATLDAMGPFHVLSELTGVKVFFIARNKGLVRNSAGLTMQVDTSIGNVDKVDILVIPGGLRETYSLAHDSTLLAWIRKIDKTTTFTTSVCTGSWILGATGLLKGKSATTHWYGKEMLAADYGAKVNRKKTERWVRDGKYWTSAGVTAGMDMSLAIVKEIMGEKYTKITMLDLEYDPKPPFQGGSEHNTDKALVEMMRSMYDGGIKPLRDSLRTR
jgi:putative intracellular protease/amidase